MKLVGNPGPSRITVVFEEGEFRGKSLTINAEPIVGGIVLLANGIKKWDDQQDSNIDEKDKKKIVRMIRKEINKHQKHVIIKIWTEE